MAATFQNENKNRLILELQLANFKKSYQVQNTVQV